MRKVLRILKCYGSASLWSGSGSYLSLWCGSRSYLSILARILVLPHTFPQIWTSSAPKWPSKASTFSLWCSRSGSCFHLAADPDPAFHFYVDPDPDPAPKTMRIHLCPDPQHWGFWIGGRGNWLYPKSPVLGRGRAAPAHVQPRRTRVSVRPVRRGIHLTALPI